MMIEVVTFDRRGDRIDTAETDEPDAALVAGRTLWDDAMRANPRQGFRVAVGFYAAGELVRMVEGRP